MALCLAAAVVAGGCGDDEPPRRDPFAKLERDFERAPAAVAAPRWERVETARGSGPRTVAVSIDDDAIQWRARWSCRSGAVRLAVEPRPHGSEPLAGSCPDRGRGEYIGSGEYDMRIEADGPWRLAVDQQVETPLSESPPAGELLARGTFRKIERASEGTASQHRLASGRLVLRFERFRTSATSDLFVWIGRGRAPKTTREALASAYHTVGPLKSTLGDQNYVLPKGTGPSDVRSVVIWCQPVRIAYADAMLRPA